MSPWRTTTAPEACLAILPVSNEISLPAISTETRVTASLLIFTAFLFRPSVGGSVSFFLSPNRRSLADGRGATADRWRSAYRDQPAGLTGTARWRAADSPSVSSCARKRSDGRQRSRERPGASLAQAELFDQRAVALEVAALQVVQEAPAAADEHQQAAARVVVFAAARAGAR